MCLSSKLWLSRIHRNIRVKQRSTSTNTQAAAGQVLAPATCHSCIRPPRWQHERAARAHVHSELLRVCVSERVRVRACKYKPGLFVREQMHLMLRASGAEQTSGCLWKDWRKRRR